MRSPRCLFLLIDGFLCLTAAACGFSPPNAAIAAVPTSSVPPTPEVLQLEQGERRTRRGSTDVVILKVDAHNGGSSDLVMGYELVPLGHTIAPHRHLDADEIIFVHAGSGVADVGGHQTSFGPGATIYIPKNVRVSVQNTGAVPLAIAFFFSRPGFDAYLRDVSVPEGQPAPPLSGEERAAIRARHGAHVVYEQP
jgi:mannose-6-phosphate isomerase-like protein (cupin superfamily)